ncbi:FAD-dependent oxidoreductase [Marivivens sp.]|uniref:FAD-dependent oxidoreductase n=1 Tax=Marivivens sp. TaxID=1978374 RepID=UPI0025B9F7D6|nr:FAD-dependent oxidoreductase [Marivivens sp.]
MNTAQTHDVIVIGAGIIGISTALKLQSEGQNVLVIDREGIAQGASFGNVFSALACHGPHHKNS